MGVQQEDPDRRWSDAGVFESAPGVFRIPLPMPNDGLRAVNAYALLGENRVSLIDPGVAIEASDGVLRAALKQLDVGLDEVDQVLVTHMHYDHYSQAVQLRKAYDFVLQLGRHEETSVRIMMDPDQDRFASRLTMLVRYGASGLIDEVRASRSGRGGPEMALPDRWIEDEDEFSVPRRTLRAVHTPGHTRGHVVFADEACEFTFTGDHILPEITPSIGFESNRSPLPLGDYLQSLRRVRLLPDARMLPAHGPVRDSIHARVDELVDHHHRRLDRCAAAVAQDFVTASDVASKLTWTRRDRALDELDLFNRTLAILETGAHLDLLVTQQRLTCVDDDGVWRYHAAS